MNVSDFTHVSALHPIFSIDNALINTVRGGGGREKIRLSRRTCISHKRMSKAVAHRESSHPIVDDLSSEETDELFSLLQ